MEIIPQALKPALIWPIPLFNEPGHTLQKDPARKVRSTSSYVPAPMLFPAPEQAVWRPTR